MTELAVYQPSDAPAQQQASMQERAVGRLAEWANAASAAFQVAERLCQTSFVPDAFRNKPMDATAAILAGSEVGLSPLASLRSFDIINGVAAPRAITLRAIVQSQGHEIILDESTATRCKMSGRRRDSAKWQHVMWTIDRARDLGLANKPNWKSQPTAMLLARATSEICRLVASDAILGIGFSLEEVGDGVEAEESAPPEPPSTTGRVMSRTRRNVDPPVSDAEREETLANIEEAVANPEESPLLNTSSSLAKAMYAAFNEYGITDRDERLAYVAKVIGRDVDSSSAMSEDDARKVIDAMRSQLERPFGDTDA